MENSRWQSRLDLARAQGSCPPAPHRRLCRSKRDDWRRRKTPAAPREMLPPIRLRGKGTVCGRTLCRYPCLTSKSAKRNTEILDQIRWRRKKTCPRFGPPAESKRDSHAELNLSPVHRRMDGSEPKTIQDVLRQTRCCHSHTSPPDLSFRASGKVKTANRLAHARSIRMCSQVSLAGALRANVYLISCIQYAVFL